MSNPPILQATPNAISLLASASGAMRYVNQDGLTVDLFGRVVARANPLAQQATGAVSPTSVISGPPGSISSASVALQLSLVSKLKARLTTDGSTLFKLTWKEKTTPAGRLVYRLAASARRTSDNDSGLWPTPNTMEGGQTSRGGKRKGELLMGGLVGWPTPNTMDTLERTKMRPSRAATGRETGYLTEAVVDYAAPLSSWPTASARDWKDTSGMSETGTNPDGSTRSRLDQLPRVAGLTAIGSPAATARPGQLNPAHSRWLMGLPPEWDACAPTVMPSSRKSRKPS
jgi:hypothetical protein